MTESLQNTAATPPGENGISVSAAALARLGELFKSEGKDGQMLRIYVNGGGCSGFTYGFDFDDTVNEDDRTFANGDVTVVSDEASLELIGGSQLDWVETLGASAFQLNNPNATASCGCGASFSV